MEINLRYRADLHKIIDLNYSTVELGVAEGNFSNDILSWGKQTHYLVDAWMEIKNQKGDGGNEQLWHERNLQKTMAKVEKYGGRAIILRGLSQEMAVHVEDNSCGFVNVDCDHSYEGVKRDIEAWWPKLIPGGVMAFHDYEMTQYGVKRAVREFADSQRLTVHLLAENKLEDAGAYIIKC